jgi:hypothetical protein
MNANDSCNPPIAEGQGNNAWGASTKLKARPMGGGIQYTKKARAREPIPAWNFQEFATGSQEFPLILPGESMVFVGVKKQGRDGRRFQILRRETRGSRKKKGAT